MRLDCAALNNPESRGCNLRCNGQREGMKRMSSQNEPHLEMDDQSFDATCDFIDKLGAAAHRYGASSFRLESYLSRVTAALGLHGDFLVTPGVVDSVLWQEEGKGQRIRINREEDGVNLARLEQVTELVEEVEGGDFSVEDGVARLNAIDKSPAPFGPLMTAVSFGLIGAGFAVLLSLAWHDVIIGVVLSLVVYAVVFLLGRSPQTARMINPMAAFVAAILAYVIAATLVPSSNHVMTTLCAVIALIPNPGLVLGVGELSSGQLLSGAARLVSAIVTLIELAFGAYLGTSIASAMMTIAEGTAASSMAPYWAWVAVVVLGLGLAMLFQVRPKDFVWVVAGCLLAWAGIVVGGKLLGSGPGDLLGALALGIFANVYALKMRRSASVVLLPGLMVLAPGFASYLGLGTLQASGVEAGWLAEFKVFETLVWIIGGLFLANTVIPPKSTL
jgi:uncharacterized membrane protein YjjP (DUF1212 family)